MKKLYTNPVLTGCICIILFTGVLYATTFWAEDIVLDQLETKIEQTQQSFHTEQNLRFNRLVESAYLLAENSTFKANLQLQDPATIQYSIKEFSLFVKTDLFIVMDPDGTILGSLNNLERKNKNLSDKPTIKRALQEKEKKSAQWPELEYINGNLYQVVTVPVYAGRERIIGAITLGTKFTNIEVGKFKQRYPFNISLFYKDTLLASSQKEINLSDYNSFLDLNNSRIADAIEKTQPSKLIKGKIASHPVYAFISPLGIGEPAFCICSISISKAMRFQQEFELKVLWAGVAGNLIIAILIFAPRLYKKVT